MADIIVEKCREDSLIWDNGNVGVREIISQCGSQVDNVVEAVNHKTREEYDNEQLTIEKGNGLDNEQNSLELQNHDDGRKKRGTYTKYSRHDKHEIGKAAAENCNVFAQRKFQSIYPSLSESTVRHFKGVYLNKQKLKKERKQAVNRRGKYQVYSDEERALIGKCAFETGNSYALQQFQRDFPKLSESTVRGFKTAYMKELNRLAGDNCNSTNECDTRIIAVDNPPSENNCETVIKFLPKGKRGRPGKVPTSIEKTILNYLEAISSNAKGDIKLTPKTAIVIAKGVIMTENRNLLSEFGGELNIDKGWAQSFLHRHNLNFNGNLSGLSPEKATSVIVTLDNFVVNANIDEHQNFDASKVLAVPTLVGNTSSQQC